MKSLLIFLLVAWLVISLLGALIEGLLWLLFVGLVLLVATAVWGWLTRGRASGRSSRA